MLALGDVMLRDRQTTAALVLDDGTIGLARSEDGTGAMDVTAYDRAEDPPFYALTEEDDENYGNWKRGVEHLLPKATQAALKRIQRAMLTESACQRSGSAG